MFKFIAGFLSDDSGRPSSQRVCIFLLTVFVMIVLAAAQFKAKEWAIPTVTTSFVELVEWLFTALGVGILAPKVMTGVQAIKGSGTDQIVAAAGATGPMGPQGPTGPQGPVGPQGEPNAG